MNPDTETAIFYYCNDNGSAAGPHTWEQLLELYGNGVISNATVICPRGEDKRTTFGNFMLAEEQVLVHALEVAVGLSDP